MQIYWTLKSSPELSELPSEKMRRVGRAAFWKTTRHWQFWASFLVLGLCVHIGQYFYAPIGGYIGVVVGSFIFSQVSIHVARPALLSPEHASGR